MAHQIIKDSFKLALAQLNPVVGDLEENCRKARQARAQAAASGADLIAFTELYLTGYPIEDLVLKPALQKAARAACEELAGDTGDGGPAILIGLPWGDGPFVYNPAGLKGEEIPIGSRIVSVIDAYDAMISNRCYRQGLSHDEAVRRLLESGGAQFDPVVVRTFVEIAKEEAADVFAATGVGPSAVI